MTRKYWHPDGDFRGLVGRHIERHIRGYRYFEPQMGYVDLRPCVIRTYTPSIVGWCFVPNPELVLLRLQK